MGNFKERIEKLEEKGEVKKKKRGERG